MSSVTRMNDILGLVEKLISSEYENLGQETILNRTDFSILASKHSNLSVEDTSSIFFDEAKDSFSNQFVLTPTTSITIVGWTN